MSDGAKGEKLRRRNGGRLGDYKREIAKANRALERLADGVDKVVQALPDFEDVWAPEDGSELVDWFIDTMIEIDGDERGCPREKMGDLLSYLFWTGDYGRSVLLAWAAAAVSFGPFDVDMFDAEDRAAAADYGRRFSALISEFAERYAALFAEFEKQLNKGAK
jgi:hypothetical protein